MFNKARLKLTGWYLLIIMVVSLAFSAVIYRESSLELERFAAAQRSRFERRILMTDAPTPSLVPTQSPLLDEELIGETEQRILMSLILINVGILSLAGILGYYLSGKTLSPIHDMMEEQYRFVTDASHELKTPITAIKTTLEVSLRDTKLSVEDAKETLSTSLEEVNHLQKLAEGLLELTHKNSAIELTPTKISDVIQTATKTIEPLAKKKKIILHMKIPILFLQLETLSMTRALVAILDNAIKYSPARSEISVISSIKGKTFFLQIKDQGKGIEEEDMPFVFDRFYRTDKARNNDSVTGYGLGLSIAKEIISAHHGDIEIMSEVGKGTTVTIELPYSARLQQKEIN